jgi:hypothetical protein
MYLNCAQGLLIAELSITRGYTAQHNPQLSSDLQKYEGSSDSAEN